MSKKISNQFLCSRMMLPEHQAKLDSYRKNLIKEEKFKKIILDEVQKQEFECLLRESLYSGLEITITYLTRDKYSVITGIVRDIDTNLKKIHLLTDNKTQILDANNIIKIHLFDS